MKRNEMNRIKWRAAGGLKFMKLPQWTYLAMALFLLGGCAVGRSDFSLLNPSAHYDAKSADAPVFLTTRDLEDPYEEIGLIHVSGTTREGYEVLNAKLRAQARIVGADAVIHIGYGLENAFSIVPIFISIPYDVITAEGLAVRTKNNGVKR